MIVVLLIYILVTLLLSFKNPTLFVIYYLLVTTKFLGFFDVEYYFVIGGVGLGYPLLNIVTAVAALFKIKRQKSLRKSFSFTGPFVLFLLYGILYPFLSGLENLQQAITTSKEFWYISIFMYLMLNDKYVNKLKLINFIKGLGVYLSLTYVFFFLFKMGPPFYVEENAYRTFFPTYISLSLFLVYIDFRSKKLARNMFLLLGLLFFVGILLSGYFSLMVSTIVMINIFSFINKKRTYSFNNFFLSGMIFMLISLTLYFIYPKIENIIFNSIDDIITGKDVALSSRYIYNEFRWDAIKERPMFGYGFIHKDASVTKSVRLIDDNRFAEKFGVIDSGYIDLLIKYGYIGMTLYLILWAKNFIPIILKPSKYRLLQIGMSLYLLQYFLVNYTWSVFSFAHGLVPAFIALYLIKSKYILKKRPVNIKLHNFE